MQRVYRLQPSELDKANRSTDFQLLPTNPAPPIISAELARGFYQTTWFDRESRNDPKQLVPTVSVIQMVEGTQFGMTVIAIDPSNLQNPNDDRNLKYVWKRNGLPIYDINKLNNNRGIRGINVQAKNCTPDLSGTYTVEISNQHGTTTSANLIIEIFKYTEHPLLYKNLIFNGNGDEGLDGWVADSGIRTEGYYFEGIPESNNFGSFNVRLNRPLDDNGQSWTLDTVYPQKVFHFNKGRNWANLPFVYNSIQNQDPVIQESWFDYAASWPAALVLNERKGETKLANFFPDPKWIDEYNTNTGASTATLTQELEQSTAYFTRDKIRFNKYTDSGQNVVRASQIIDLTEVGDMIDGNVFGVDQLTGQFFAYMGIGLSRYKVKVPFVGQGTTVPRDGLNPGSNQNEGAIQTGSTDTNWFILDTSTYKNTGTDFASRGPTSVFYPEGGINENIPIELVPVVDDSVSVEIAYLDEDDNLILKNEIDGPTDRDIFAVKEKFYMPAFLEVPIEKGIPYKSIDVYDVYNVDAIRSALINLRDNGSFSMPSGDGRVDAVSGQSWYNDVVNNAFDPIIDALNWAYDGVDRTAVLDDDFYNRFYRDVADIIIEQQLSEDEDPRNSSNSLRNQGSIYHFQYLQQAKFRNSSVFNQWRYAMLLANDGYQRRRDGITEREAYQYQQRFYIFEQFLNYANANKTTRTDAIRYRNPITIYGQPYTTVDAIARTADPNLAWIKENLNRPRGGISQPFGQPRLNSTEWNLEPDPGAAAFFAIEFNELIPKNTRKVQITFIFKHSSEAADDTSPESKNWNEQEIYIDLFGNTEEEKDVYLKYGAPRCGITAMKYVLYPKDPTYNPKYNGYYIPNENVWYKERERLNQDVHNSSTRLVFDPIYLNTITPLAPPSSVVTEGRNITTQAVQIDRAAMMASAVTQSRGRN